MRTISLAAAAAFALFCAPAVAVAQEEPAAEAPAAAAPAATTAVAASASPAASDPAARDLCTATFSLG